MDYIISFSNKDLARIYNPNNNSIIVSVMIAKPPVKRILVDSESLDDVLLYDTFVRTNLSLNYLKPVFAPLVAFDGKSIGAKGEITLLVTTGTPPRLKMVFITFAVVRVHSVYNAILGHLELNHLDAAISTKHLLVHFSMDNNVGEMQGD